LSIPWQVGRVGATLAAVEFRGRSWSRLVVLVFVVASLGVAVRTAPPTLGSTITPLTKPNVVLFLLDDVTVDAVPHTPALMPYLESRLADPTDHWIRFSNAFLNTPICCPTRATIFSGRYSHITGVETNAQGRNLDDTSTVATWMHNAGYFTSLIGKYINHFPFGAEYFVPPGWDHWDGGFGHYFEYDVYNYDVRSGEPGRVEHYGTAEADYEADVIARKASAFVDEAPPQPFFLYLSPKTWHDPYIPAPRYAGKFAGIAPTRRPSFNEVDVSDKPAWVQKIPLLSATSIANQDNLRRRAYETLPAADDALKSIMEAVERRGELDNTVVIVMSDNGFAFGEHRWKSKKCIYEECSRTPLFVRYPGATPRTEARLVSSVDIAQTVAALGGATPATPVDGRSLVPLLTGDDPGPWRKGVLIHTIDDGYTSPGYWAVHTGDMVYAEYTTGEKELYDLTGAVGAADPYQLDNAANTPAYVATQAELAGLLAQLKDGADPNEGDPPPPATTTSSTTATTAPTATTTTTTVAAPIVAVVVNDAAFTPAHATVPLPWSVLSPNQATVEWRNRGTRPHTATEAIGLGPSGSRLFNSGRLPVNGTFRYSFVWAGTYAYRDSTRTSVKGTIKVPMLAGPATGDAGTLFTLRFALGTPPAHVTFDVQIKRPGATTFSSWATAVSRPSRWFTADAGPGDYLFRSRVHTSAGKVSAWSPAATITVT
jgi:N-acetylglucosamine-6-sulfatase